jgi:hypothetical protein
MGQVAVKRNTTGERRTLARVRGRRAIWGAVGRQGVADNGGS